MNKDCQCRILHTELKRPHSQANFCSATSSAKQGSSYKGNMAFFCPWSHFLQGTEGEISSKDYLPGNFVPIQLVLRVSLNSVSIKNA